MKKTFSGSSWDAILNSDVCDPYNNADLEITLKVGLRQVNPTGGARNGTYNDYGDSTEPTRKITKWDKASWSAWTSTFARTAQRYWNGKFWLLNDDPSLDYTVKGVTFRPNLYCKFKLKVVTTKAHHTIDVVRLDKSETWFGSHSTLYDSLDTKPTNKGKDSKGSPIMQRAHVHEVGHLLGLGHIDEGKAHCPSTGNTNAKKCYGVADVDKLSVMGSGMKLRKEFAAPWQTAYHVTLVGNWVELIKDTSVEMKRHYPRTLAEVKARKKIIRRPRR